MGVAVSYTIDQHKHLYASWCAARAYGRGLANGGNETAFKLISAAGLDQVKGPDDIGEDVDAWQLELMDRIMVAAAPIPGFEFGHAQKLVNIYLKTVLVCGGHHNDPKVACLHPPVDSKLLDGLRSYLSKERVSQGEARKAFLAAQRVNSRWSTFKRKHYLAHIEAIKMVMAGRPLYLVEEHWRIKPKSIATISRL